MGQLKWGKRDPRASAPLLPFELQIDARALAYFERERPQTQLEWADMWAKPFDRPELL